MSCRSPLNPEPPTIPPVANFGRDAKMPAIVAATDAQAARLNGNGSAKADFAPFAIATACAEISRRAFSASICAIDAALCAAHDTIWPATPPMIVPRLLNELARL